MPFRKNARAGRKSRPRRLRNRTAKPSRAFAKKVQKVIQKDVESKDVSYTLPYTSFNSGVNSTGDVLRICPQLPIGTNNGNRIGDQIKGQSLNVKGHMLINVVPTMGGTGVVPTGIPANARLMVRAFLFSVKRYSNYDDAVANQANWAPQFLKNGASVQALDGTIPSMYLPVNTDVITVHKEIKKYITIEALATYTGAGAITNTTTMAGIGFQDSVSFFEGNIKCKKTIKYDIGNTNPQNFAPLMCLSYCHLDGSSPDVLTTVISASYVSTLKYEDA